MTDGDQPNFIANWDRLLEELADAAFQRLSGQPGDTVSLSFPVITGNPDRVFNFLRPKAQQWGVVLSHTTGVPQIVLTRTVRGDEQSGQAASADDWAALYRRGVEAQEAILHEMQRVNVRADAQPLVSLEAKLAILSILIMILIFAVEQSQRY